MRIWLAGTCTFAAPDVFLFVYPYQAKYSMHVHKREREREREKKNTVFKFSSVSAIISASDAEDHMLEFVHQIRAYTLENILGANLR